jgi:hypothetical protein
MHMRLHYSMLAYLLLYILQITYAWPALWRMVSNTHNYLNTCLYLTLSNNDWAIAAFGVLGVILAIFTPRLQDVDARLGEKFGIEGYSLSHYLKFEAYKAGKIKAVLAWILQPQNFYLSIAICLPFLIFVPWLRLVLFLLILFVGYKAIRLETEPTAERIEAHLLINATDASSEAYQFLDNYIKTVYSKPNHPRLRKFYVKLQRAVRDLKTKESNQSIVLGNLLATIWFTVGRSQNSSAQYLIFKEIELQGEHYSNTDIDLLTAKWKAYEAMLWACSQDNLLNTKLSEEYTGVMHGRSIFGSRRHHDTQTFVTPNFLNTQPTIKLKVLECIIPYGLKRTDEISETTEGDKNIIQISSLEWRILFYFSQLYITEDTLNLKRFMQAHTESDQYFYQAMPLWLTYTLMFQGGDQWVYERFRERLRQTKRGPGAYMVAESDEFPIRETTLLLATTATCKETWSLQWLMEAYPHVREAFYITCVSLISSCFNVVVNLLWGKLAPELSRPRGSFFSHDFKSLQQYGKLPRKSTAKQIAELCFEPWLNELKIKHPDYEIEPIIEKYNALPSQFWDEWHKDVPYYLMEEYTFQPRLFDFGVLENLKTPEQEQLRLALGFETPEAVETRINEMKTFLKAVAKEMLEKGWVDEIPNEYKTAQPQAEE